MLARSPGSALFSLRVCAISGILDEKVAREPRTTCQRDRRADDTRRARRVAATHPHHGLRGLERRRGIRHRRRALPRAALALAPVRQHRSRGVVALRPLPALRPLQSGPAPPADREAVSPRAASALWRPESLGRDVTVGVAVEPHLKWRT